MAESVAGLQHADLALKFPGHPTDCPETPPLGESPGGRCAGSVEELPTQLRQDSVPPE